VKSSRWLWLAVLSVSTACNIYNQDLIDRARGDDSGPSGGSDTGGEPNDGDGGRTSGGGAPGGGGDGPDGGTGGDMGGAPPDGGTGGEETGGTSGGGAPGGGGSGGSGGGSGGAPVVYIGLIDDFNGTTAGYSNPPFYGTWGRYAQDENDGLFTAASVTAMMQPDPDDAANGAFQVAATMLDDWGVGVFVTLKSGAAVDLSDGTGIRFRARTMNSETILKVAIADVHSHRNACLDVDAGADCDKHMRTVTDFALDASWAEIDLPLDEFIDPVIDGTNDRTSALDLTQVFALHFQMDPVDEEVDFYLDDLEIY
jgi:hypothetical protein